MKLFSTSCETLFLGWDGPLLPRAASVLRERFAAKGRLDLRNLICVLPASRSANRMRVLLRKEAEQHELRYDAPDIITVGELPERLYESRLPLALEFERTLSWARVLRAQGPEDLEPLIPVVPAAHPIEPWLELAGTLRHLEEELASNRISFSDVVDAAETDAEKRRWNLLCRLHTEYRKELGEAGLSDPHLVREQAVTREACRCDRTIVLIGVSDLSDAQVAMLRSLDSELLAVVAAPQDAASRFDEFGCVDTSSWIDHRLPLEDGHLITAGDIGDQAGAVTEVLAQFAPRHLPSDVTVGVTDESHVAPVEMALRGCGVSTFRNLGWSVGRTSVGRLLDLLATYLRRRTWTSLAALVRHADVSAKVTSLLEQEYTTVWLSELDQMLAQHYPVRVREPLPPKALSDYPLAARVAEVVEAWLGAFSAPDQSIARWSQVIDQWLQDCLDATARDPEFERTRTARSFRAASRVLQRFSRLNDRLDLAVGGAGAIEMVTGRMEEVRVVGESDVDDVNVVGWLDLALDDSAALIVIGLNHPFVPAAVTSDPFLPGTLRSRLRMADNDRRFARDCYAMHLMLASRHDVRFIVGRTAADLSPTPPSRLLSAAPAEDAARRIRNLIGGKRDAVSASHRWDEGPESTALPIPTLAAAKGEKIGTLSVTAFRDYLVCPYRFYLRHVLRLRPVDDAGGELAANQFGDLVHAAVERFGESTDRDETDRSRIETALLGYLHEYAEEQYGNGVSTAVTLQIAQAERRLKTVATRQAERVAAGWRIHATEASVDESDGAGIDVDGRRMGLRGRFDRIDVHPESGRWAILDYKTHGQRPEKKHLVESQDGDRWIDLQLPLYRLMIPYLGIDADPSAVDLGYFNVSGKETETGVHIANFSEAQLQQAEEQIRQCIRQIWAGQFDATSEHVQFDDYSMILQTGVASRLLDEAVSLSGPEVPS